jgi:hypothetical protein
MILGWSSEKCWAGAARSAGLEQREVLDWGSEKCWIGAAGDAGPEQQGMLGRSSRGCWAGAAGDAGLDQQLGWSSKINGMTRDIPFEKHGKPQNSMNSLFFSMPFIE